MRITSDIIGAVAITVVGAVATGSLVYRWLSRSITRACSGWQTP